MKIARLISKTGKNTRLYATGKGEAVSGRKKTSLRHILAKSSSKISPIKQFLEIKAALKEVELIRAGKIKAKTLDELLDEL